MEELTKRLHKEGKSRLGISSEHALAMVSPVHPSWYELKQAEAWQSFVDKKSDTVVFWLQLQTGRQANKECI